MKFSVKAVAFLVAITIICITVYYVKKGSFEWLFPFLSVRGITSKTIIAIRHGEKPKAGLGNLNCVGLNRSLKIPGVLLPRFGKPDYIFAPNPAVEMKDHGTYYHYIRPLATIEPTAIRCGLPVNTQFGCQSTGDLVSELNKSKYDNKLIFAAWEHHNLVLFARKLVSEYGLDPHIVGEWPDDDFDTIFIFKVVNGKLTFSKEKEGLNGQSSVCPT